MPDSSSLRQRYIDYICSKGSVNAGDAARYMKVSFSAAREYLRAMARAGYLEKFNAPNDRGITVIHYKLVSVPRDASDRADDKKVSQPPGFFEAGRAYLEMCNDLLYVRRFVSVKQVEAIDSWFRTYSCIHAWSFDNPYDIPEAL